jgi:hypothetical protein
MDKIITLFSDFGTRNFNFNQPLNISQIVGNEVRAIKPINQNHLVIISADGILSVYKHNFKKNTANPVKILRIPLQRDEEVSAMAVSPKGSKVVIATSFNLKASQLMMFRLGADFGPKFEGKFNLGGEFYSESEMSFIQDLTMDFEIEGEDRDVVVAFQYGGENLVIAFVFDHGEFGYLTSPNVYHCNLFCKCVYVEGEKSLWSIDKTGAINKLSLLI